MTGLGAPAPSATPTTPLSPVYGPVSSWRLGRSLGIDPIGAVSTCSFDCVYCQLGEIEVKTFARRVFVPTEDIAQALAQVPDWEAVDVVTVSGSGEPTLALNLGEILAIAHDLSQRPTVVLTNSTLLGDAQVQRDLAHADRVMAKWDAPSAAALQRISRPVAPLEREALWQDLCAFRQTYAGRLDIQTMVLSPWSAGEVTDYCDRMIALAPHEIQLNTPTRPRPLVHQLDARGNHAPGDRPYATRSLRQVDAAILAQLARHIQDTVQVPVRCAPRPA